MNTTRIFASLLLVAPLLVAPQPAAAVDLQEDVRTTIEASIDASADLIGASTDLIEASTDLIEASIDLIEASLHAGVEGIEALAHPVLERSEVVLRRELFPRHDRHVASHLPCDLGSVDGFQGRVDLTAFSFLLRVHGLTLPSGWQGSP